MFVYCECCVLSGRGLCDVLVTCPEESYRLWRVVVCDQETSKNEEEARYRAVESATTMGCNARKTNRQTFWMQVTCGRSDQTVRYLNPWDIIIIIIIIITTYFIVEITLQVAQIVNTEQLQISLSLSLSLSIYIYIYADSNPASGMDVYLLWILFVVR
jgi:hypothetical protein